MPRIHVMAAALMDTDGQVLIARRPPAVHLGGLWEFPGGKREAGESREQALARELHEELGIRIQKSRPLIAICHDYPDRQILLDVWRVTRWQGRVQARESQPLAWVPVQELHQYEFPAADRPVLKALRLPDRYLITPPPGSDPQAWLAGLQASLTDAVRLLQIRAPGQRGAALESLVSKALAICRQHNPQLRILVNGDPDLARDCGADGVHLNRRRLWTMAPRKPGVDWLLAASCHDQSELRQAALLGVDFAVLGPLAATPSHPGAPGLGWRRFSELVAGAEIPVYALGGMLAADRQAAFEAGGQGIAAIRAWWEGSQG